jgi:hypothetical protein
MTPTIEPIVSAIIQAASAVASVHAVPRRSVCQ